MKVVLALLALLLAGCTGLLQSVSDAAHRDAEQSGKMLASAREGNIRTHTIDDVVVDNGIWLSGRTVKLAQAAGLPPVFSQPVTFDRQVASLQEFSERITRLAQVPAKVSADAVVASERALSGAPAGLGKANQTVNLPPLPTGRGAAVAAATANTGFMASSVRILYRSGDLKGLLDTACARFGVSWKYTDGAIDFYFTDTRTFQVSAVPGDSSVNANVVSEASNTGGTQSSGAGVAGSIAGGGGNGSGTSNGVSSNNTSTTAVNSQLSIFGSLESAIKAMLSPYGHVVSAPATGSISVTDTPDVLDRVARFMEEQNRVMSRQILVNVTVLSVTLSADDSYGINWGAVYQALGSRFSLTSAFTSGLTSATTLGAQVISPNSRADGTAALISALSKQGAVRRKTSASVTTLNNQPVPIQVATQQGYLASISTTNTANVGSQTSLTPGTVTTGFNMTLLPHMLDDGTVLMQFYTNLSVLDALQTVSSGGANPLQIQTPQIDTRNFLQRVAMKSGETLVISGYEGAADNSTQQGVGKPSNILLGGGYDARRSREVIVILITPLTVRTASGA
ncbi:PilN family type IVB pilus formation outer membrane protein [Trinickia sp. Y13]|uniref:PilN family type IVB pilus formation outer membrane protein n=1 Tax=Trinickia sp. Y13 TaxID=2917807 RepID=UPI002406EA5B|nr:PilN family type IVB pilus formation outer membrane protein [Trinickia sp. Y13]MDG0025496.1 PilN family type IVB pilus formation outer membrane protein [Trinickia sp. Y13]